MHTFHFFAAQLYVPMKAWGDNVMSMCIQLDWLPMRAWAYAGIQAVNV